MHKKRSQPEIFFIFIESSSYFPNLYAAVMLKTLLLALVSLSGLILLGLVFT